MMLNRAIFLLIICFIFWFTASAQTLMMGDPWDVPIQPSGIEPPQTSDRVFVVNQGEGLDTGCKFGGQLRITLPINRVISKIDRGTYPADYNANLSKLVQSGYISEFFRLRMIVSDVDYAQGERDDVYFNGVRLDGQLTGSDNEPSLYEALVPINLLKFGKFSSANPYAVPFDSTPSDNIIEVNIDTTNQMWCTQVEWASVSFEAMSPMVLIHGNASRGGFFYDQGFTNTLVDGGLVFDNSLNMPYPANYIEKDTTRYGISNQKRIQAHLRTVTKAFGVDSLHLVMHSKGGLDTRAYLANLYPQDKQQFKILSYTTLSTPHNGSIMADQIVKYNNTNKDARFVTFEGFPPFADKLASLVSLNPGHENLTTEYLEEFNRRNIPRLRETASETDFYTIAADADNNISGGIDRQNVVEYIHLTEESGVLPFDAWRVPLPIAQALNYLVVESIDGMYQTIKNTKKIELWTEYVYVLPPGGGNRVRRLIYRLKAIPTSAPAYNDTLVSLDSGHGVGSIHPLVRLRKTYTINEGRNHSTIANDGVAIPVIGWILSTEKRNGDLKSLP